MDVVINRNENDIVETYWSMLSALSRTVKLKLASRLTDSVIAEETKEQTSPQRKAKVKRRAVSAPSDAELEKKFADLPMPRFPKDDFTSKDIIDANSGKMIKSIEKWL